jgi:hypothetical protein
MPNQVRFRGSTGRWGIFRQRQGSTQIRQPKKMSSRKHRQRLNSLHYSPHLEYVSETYPRIGFDQAETL